MDVRCERCRAQYVFDDEQVTPQGLTVQCTNCGHVFRVKKKELVVTVPVRPEDVTEQPMLASAASLRPHVDAPQQGWTIRQAGGATLAFTELTTLQKWIVERKVARDDEVSQGDDAWVRLGTIGELQTFFDVVEAAERGRHPPPPMTRPGGTDFYPPPPPSFAPAAPAAAAPARPAPAAAAPQAPGTAEGSLTTELDAEELAAVRGRKGGRTRLAVAALLLVAVGAAGYVFAPALLGGQAATTAVVPAAPPPAARPAPETVAVPITIELKAPPDALPAPEPTADVPQPRAPEPVPVAAPARPAGPKALLAQAAALRARGEPARALDLYGKVVAVEPDNVEAQTGRGLCYFELGQYAPAEASFQRALQLDLDHPDAIMGLAETYRQQGQKAEALRLFERYLAVNPGGEEAAVARYAISQLKE
jgi:predicted Zn finger-like uncharacterized protein